MTIITVGIIVVEFVLVLAEAVFVRPFASVLLLGFGIVWMSFREKQMAKKGIGWTENPNGGTVALEDIPEMNYDCSPSDEDEHQNYDGMGREACSA